MLIFVIGFIMELLKWAQPYVSPSRKTWALIACNKTLAEALEDHSCDFGSKALVYFATWKRSLGWEQYMRSTIKQTDKKLFVLSSKVSLESPWKVQVIIENLVQPGAVEMVEIILGQEEAARLKKVPLLSDTIKWVQTMCWSSRWRDPEAAGPLHFDERGNVSDLAILLF